MYQINVPLRMADRAWAVVGRISGGCSLPRWRSILYTATQPASTAPMHVGYVHDAISASTRNDRVSARHGPVVFTGGQSGCRITQVPTAPAWAEYGYRCPRTLPPSPLQSARRLGFVVRGPPATIGARARQDATKSCETIFTRACCVSRIDLKLVWPAARVTTGTSSVNRGQLLLQQPKVLGTGWLGCLSATVGATLTGLCGVSAHLRLARRPVARASAYG
jgi:hypothetical protein